MGSDLSLGTKNMWPKYFTEKFQFLSGKKLGSFSPKKRTQRLSSVI